MKRRPLALATLLLLVLTPTARPETATVWQHPPQGVLDVLNAPELPTARVSPTGDELALMTVLRYPPLADLARPSLRLAGTRFNPRTNGRHGEYVWTAVSLLGVKDGRERRLTLPREARIYGWEWSPDGRRFAFLNHGTDSVELWVGETANGEARQIRGIRINPVLQSELNWMPDGRTLLVKRVPPDRGSPPDRPPAPSGPRVQESTGHSATSTYEARDLLTSPYDEALFAYYALSQLALVDVESGRIKPVGGPEIIGEVQPGPDGRLILVELIRKPWSYSFTWSRFPRDLEIWDVDGKKVHTAARRPLADQVPIHGVPEGPRDLVWRPTEPATLVWLEALDGGDPGRAATHRDRVMMQRAPFRDEPREVYRAPHRIWSLSWGERDGLLLVSEYERARRWRYMRAVNADDPSAEPQLLFDLSMNEQYKNPGNPVYRRIETGGWVLAQEGDAIFLDGAGASPEGERPFLDRFSLTSLKSERLFRSADAGYEDFIDWLDLDSKTFLTRRESPTEAPNYLVRTLGERIANAATGESEWASNARPLTHFPDPTPQIRGITQRIVTYQRADSTPLSFTLYLPPGYKEGTRLPTVIDAYPLEYSDPATAGQITGTDQRFLRLLGTSSLFFLLGGYAVLQDVAMPVIGHPDTAYDTFVEQLVASAEAAIDKAVEIGVTDRDRVGILGHSHGGLMTATLLAHSDLFRAGIARSAAYNHTLRPFGFQGERRTLWQAPDNYIRLSPIMYADKINEPLLLIHGEADQNPGTVPLQSEKMYQAVSGTGGTVRLVMLPHEQHGYQSREAVEDVLAEQYNWFDRYVKNAPPREAK